MKEKALAEAKAKKAETRAKEKEAKLTEEKQEAALKKQMAEREKKMAGKEQIIKLSRFREPFYYTTAAITWTPSVGQEAYAPVTVSEGFVTEFSSIPKIYWYAMSPNGEYAYASVVHEYLYWTQTRSREEADHILEMTLEDLGLDAQKAKAIYNSVRAGGQRVWSNNISMKARGEKRILVKFPDDPGTTSWSDWKQRPGVFASIAEEEKIAGDHQQAVSKEKEQQKAEETKVVKQLEPSTNTQQRSVREPQLSGPVKQQPEPNIQEQLQTQQQEVKQGEVSAPGLSTGKSQPPEQTQQQAMKQPLQKQPAEKLPSKITGKDGAPMVLIPDGEFMMGSREGDENAQRDERPAHTVYLEAYYIDQYEVTTTRYTTFFQETKRSWPSSWSEQVLKQHGQKPVVGVDWHDATTYCAWAGKRLPTEAEWEKAARGTDQRLYPWGNGSSSEQRANFNRGVDFKDYGVLTDVGSFEQGKSPYGVYDMAGNVWEWTADWYGDNSYAKSPERNPKGPSTGEYRVVRGGSWGSGPGHIRSADRNWVIPSNRYVYLGFRCAQNVPN